MKIRNSLPPNWKQIDLREVLIYSKGKRPKILKKVEFENSVPYLDIQAIEMGIIKKWGDKSSSRIISEENIVIVWDGARSGWVGIGKYGALGSTLVGITPIIVDRDYLYFFFTKKF